MPQSVVTPTPVDVLPAGLMTAFSIEERLEVFDNKYPDGSSDRLNLANVPRRFFKLSQRLTASQAAALRTFYSAHIGAPFYFYVLRETIPPWTADPTGQAPDGRYTVVFDGGWTEDLDLGRMAAQFGLREVQ
jgi:hypothetical protein